MRIARTAPSPQLDERLKDEVRVAGPAVKAIPLLRVGIPSKLGLGPSEGTAFEDAPERRKPCAEPEPAKRARRRRSRFGT